MAIIYVDTGKFHVISKERMIEFSAVASVDRVAYSFAVNGRGVINLRLAERIAAELVAAEVLQIKQESDAEQDRVNYRATLLVIRPQN